ncbi:hypothetical protein BDZ91DRAFT_723003 [Kalaharituber pfeilii]|nr:hypothetical protein BDZ91DRAFT_723003 [Kalaharituber pfeilii]
MALKEQIIQAKEEERCQQFIQSQAIEEIPHPVCSWRKCTLLDINCEASTAPVCNYQQTDLAYAPRPDLRTAECMGHAPPTTSTKTKWTNCFASAQGRDKRCSALTLLHKHCNLFLLPSHSPAGLHTHCRYSSGEGIWDDTLPFAQSIYQEET